MPATQLRTRTRIRTPHTSRRLIDGTVAHSRARPRSDAWHNLSMEHCANSLDGLRAQALQSIRIAYGDGLHGERLGSASKRASPFPRTELNRTFTIPDGLYAGSKTATANDTNLAAGNVTRGVTILGVAGTALRAQLLKTGQTTTYGAGSDGDLRNGVAASYTDNGDGTITDNRTGLMWEKKDQSGGIHDYSTLYTWGLTSSPYAMNGTMVTTFLATLNAGSGFAGDTDWRIPNVNELQGIATYEIGSPSVDPAFNTGCVASCTVINCSCTHFSGGFFAKVYWTSSTYASSPDHAWLIRFDSGQTSQTTKSAGEYVRAVRGGS